MDIQANGTRQVGIRVNRRKYSNPFLMVLCQWPSACSVAPSPVFPATPLYCQIGIDWMILLIDVNVDPLSFALSFDQSWRLNSLQRWIRKQMIAMRSYWQQNFCEIIYRYMYLLKILCVVNHNSLCQDAPITRRRCIVSQRCLVDEWSPWETRQQGCRGDDDQVAYFWIRSFWLFSVVV